MSVGRICSRTTHLVDPEESAQAAADRMRKENVGTLVVVDSLRKPTGIITDRDLVMRVVAPGLDPRATEVGQIVSQYPRCVPEETPIEDALSTMRTAGIRRLLVVDGDGCLVGLVSVDDVLELLTEELGNLGRIFSLSQPGIAVPETLLARAKQAKEPATAGLERASSDLQC